VTGAAAAAADQPDPSSGPLPGPTLMSIGEVLAQLRDDFPDITISKLRFLEAEGLVEPQRTAAGYRKYSTEDVNRLSYVLAAQRDRFLPLRVIRDYLDALDRGEPVAAGDYPSMDDPSAAPVKSADPEVPESLQRDELLERTGLSDTQLKEIEEAGLVSMRRPGWYDADALLIASAVAGLGQLGIGVRHLRTFRTTADREAGLFAAVVAPMAKSSSPSARVRAADTVRELTALTQQLHAALVRVSLRTTLGQ